MRQDTSNGIARKVYNQIDNFKKHGFDMNYMQIKYDANILMKFAKRLPIPIPHPHVDIIEKAALMDFLYVRKSVFLEGYCHNLMADAKKKCPKLKILMEVPTYAYGQSLCTAGACARSICGGVLYGDNLRMPKDNTKRNY